MPQLKTKSHSTNKTLMLIGMVLTLGYAIGAPAFDLNSRISSSIGRYFIDAQSNVTTFEEKYLYYIAFLPLFAFAFVWAYGAYKRIARRGQKGIDFVALAAAIGIVVASFLLYMLCGLYFGLTYHLRP